mmetsp:Transcript_22973/g.73948  ORF Transcript_22973/g.73948 Transcript_22973/m.73948 type:complete len:260 (-) Transcript_22973:88-867(-)
MGRNSSAIRVAIWLNQNVPHVAGKRFPAACGRVIARTWMRATSRTSTQGKLSRGSLGRSRRSSLVIVSTDVPPTVPSGGPTTKPGFTTASSMPLPASEATKSHAARSASVLLLTYALQPSPSTSVQSSSVNSGWSSAYRSRGKPYMTAATDDVTTARRTPAAAAARSTFSVPSRAGMIKSSSDFGVADGNGDATCNTNVHPSTAGAQEATSSSSASTSSRRSGKRSCMARRCASFAGRLDSDLTVPRTRCPASSSCSTQ